MEHFCSAYCMVQVCVSVVILMLTRLSHLRMHTHTMYIGTHTMHTYTCTHTHSHICHHCCCDQLCSSPLLCTNSTYAPATTWTRFIWGGEHHTDKVHLGRRGPCGRGSSGEESTTWTRFVWGGEYMWMSFIWGGEHHIDKVIWGGEHHVDEVCLERRAPHG